MNLKNHITFVLVFVITSSLFVSLPANSGIDLQTVSFPINVQFNRHLDPNSGCVRIIIDDIVLQN